MAIAFSILLVVIMLLVVALLMPAGLWGNLINLVNVTVSALVATNFWEPLSTWINKKVPSMMFITDILVLWVLFAATMFILRVATDKASKVKLRFPKLADKLGSLFFAGWSAWILACFLTMSLHTAPLGREAVFGGFRPEIGMFFGFYPDRMWLGFVQQLSERQLYNGPNHTFDPEGSFLYRYAERRAQFEKQVGLMAQPPAP